MKRVERRDPGSSGEPGLDLAERKRGAVERDDVELAPAGEEIALHDLKAAAREVLGGQLLAEAAEGSAAVGVPAHPDDATPDRVTRGSRAVPIL